MISKYEFALHWLDYRGVRIYNKGKQIFLYDGKSPYEINPEGMLNTRIKIGEELGDEDDKEEYTTMSYLDFEKLGYAIFADHNLNIFWKKAQRVAYRIVKKTRNTIGLSYESFHSGTTKLRIEHDASNRRVRLVGENALADPHLRADAGVGPWIVYDEDRPKEIMHRKDRTISKEESRAMLHKRTSLYGNEPQYQEINEIPLIISDERYIVCMKRQDTCQRIIVVGKSRFGKSTFINAVAGRIFYMWQDRMGWLIDPMNQFQDISAPQDYLEFNKVNSWINNYPTPVPALHLHMGCSEMVQVKHNKISLTLAMNIVELLRKYKLYSHGIDDWTIKGSTRYLYKYINDIKGATNGREFYDIMSEIIPGFDKDNNMQSMVNKWSTSFDSICKEKFTSNMYKNDATAADELTAVFRDGTTMKGHPFIVLAEAGAIPIINISTSRYKKWIRNYIADVLNKIMVHQMTMGDKKHRIYIIADELNVIVERATYNDYASQNMEELYRQGAFNHVGFLGNTQSLAKLNPEMCNNATHICCVYMEDPKDRKRVRETFGLGKEIDEVMRKLQKQEMMIFSKEPMVIYDRWGRRKEVTDKIWWKGRIIPPINYHQVPK